MSIKIKNVIDNMPKNSRGNDSNQIIFLASQTRSERGNLWAFCSKEGWQDAAILAADAYFGKIGKQLPININERIGYGLIALAGQDPCYEKKWRRGAWSKDNTSEITEALEAAVIAAGDIALLIVNLPERLKRAKTTKTDTTQLNNDPVAARAARLKLAPKLPEKISVTIEQFKRNPDVVDEVLYRAKGVCENCNMPAPFIRSSDGEPYLEVHHIVFLSQGGEDTVENAIALCPNCHRKAHFG